MTLTVIEDQDFPVPEMSRMQKEALRAYVLREQRALNPEVVKVRLLPTGDARAYLRGRVYILGRPNCPLA